MNRPLDQLSRKEFLQIIFELQKKVERLEREIAKRDLRIHELEQLLLQRDKSISESQEELAKAKRNSQNSSKPPSSDIIKPPPTPRDHGTQVKKRNIGGQDGHPKHESALTLADADRVVEFHADRLNKEPERDLVPVPSLQPKIFFQYELQPNPIRLTAYVAYPYWDPKTGETIYARFPAGMEEAGILGPRLTALIACLKGGIHSSYTGVEKVLGFLGVDVSRSTICNKIQNVSAALASAHKELLGALPNEKMLNVDETGHKDHPFDKKGKSGKHWIWVFAAATFTVFKIFASRGTNVLREVLGENCGAILGSDFYSAYKCFMKEAHIKVQFCWAHLIREIRFLSESRDKVTANYGRRLLKLCKLIFHLHHRRKSLGEEKYQKKMFRLKEKFLAIGRGSKALGAKNMVSRLKKYGEEYFLFLENPDVEPTNNLAERMARHCVVDRLITQGTRGPAGKQWCEHIWTVLATCQRQKRDPFAFIYDSLKAYYEGKSQPSLLAEK
jgi:transposase